MRPDHLRPDLSLALARAWRSRAQGEARVGRAFACLAAALPPGEAPAAIREALIAASAEEATHAALCEQLAESYGGAPPAPPTPDEALPLDTPEQRAVVLVSACCVSESIATAYLERCYAAAKVPHARAALHRLLADEVGHAQLGWAYLAALPAHSPQHRAIVASARGLVERTRQAWRARLGALHAAPAPAHGYPPLAACLAVVDEAARALVLRGFAHVGLRLA